MSGSGDLFQRSILEQIAINQARTPSQRFIALCELLDSARAMAPKGPEAQEQRRRAAAARELERGSGGVSNADRSLPPSGQTLEQTSVAKNNRRSLSPIRLEISPHLDTEREFRIYRAWSVNRANNLPEFTFRSPNS